MKVFLATLVANLPALIVAGIFYHLGANCPCYLVLLVIGKFPKAD